MSDRLVLRLHNAQQAHSAIQQAWVHAKGYLVASGAPMVLEVASLPCIACGIQGYSQAAHANTGKGMGMKACDLTCFPACGPRPGIQGCHAALDQGAMFTKAARRELEPVWAADTQRRIHAMGLWPQNLPYPTDPKTYEVGQKKSHQKVAFPILRPEHSHFNGSQADDNP